MSFARLAKRPEILHEVAEFFGTTVDEKAKSPVIIKALEEDGVTWDMALQSGIEGLNEVNEELKQQEAEKRANAPKTLVRMTRENLRYDVRGYTFTRDNPFQIVSQEDADYLTSQGGFRPATPKEAQEFYN
jgi:hypothetical protein